MLSAFCMACTCFCRACSDNKFTASFAEVEDFISENTLLYYTGSVYSSYQSDSPRGRPFEHLWQSKNSRKGNGQLFALWIGPLLKEWIFDVFTVIWRASVFVCFLPVTFCYLINVIKMISAQHSSNYGKNWQKLSYQKILLAW